MVDCDCIQSGESLETACSATEDRELVLDELAAAVGEDRRTAGEACAILLAFAGRRALEPEAVQQHAANDLGTAAARRLATQERGEFSCSEVVRRISVSGEAGCGGQNPHIDSAGRPKRAAMPPQRGHGDLSLTRQGRRLSLLVEGEVQNGNSG